MFLRHVIIKKLDDFLYRESKTKAYAYSHIPRPLGSISDDGSSREDRKPIEAYIYQWVQGTEGFPWENVNPNGNPQPVTLADWNDFVEDFSIAGIKMGYDVSDADDGRISKNIIHMFPYDIDKNCNMNSIWRRIDFGFQSAPFDFEKLERFFADNKPRLELILRSDRYEMTRLAIKYVNPADRLDDRGIGKLEVLVGAYRGSSLHHYTRGFSPAEGRPSFVSGHQFLNLS